jgi:hypothetical protein
MLEGRMMNFGTPHMQIMAINFVAGMESCFIAKHQALCNGFIISAYKVLQKFFRLG